jgi:formate dehydrogenase subunit gamma
MTSTTSTSGDLADLVRSAVDAHRLERGPLLVILHELQERLGFVPADAVPLLARELNLSRADVHGVVTFYKDFRTAPPGRHTVELCRAEACQSVGAEALVAELEQELGIKTGSTTANGAITLEQVFCFGNCALGPSGRIDGRVRGRLDRDTIAALITEQGR